jgi:hypothetical protein
MLQCGRTTTSLSGTPKLCGICLFNGSGPLQTADMVQKKLCVCHCKEKCVPLALYCLIIEKCIFFIGGHSSLLFCDASFFIRGIFS